MTKEYYIKTAHGVHEGIQRELNTLPVDPKLSQEFHMGRLAMLLEIAAHDETLRYEEYAKVASEVSIIRRLIREEVELHAIH
jgi:hypothetical protein